MGLGLCFTYSCGSLCGGLLPTFQVSRNQCGQQVPFWKTSILTSNFQTARGARGKRSLLDRAKPKKAANLFFFSIHLLVIEENALKVGGLG